MGSSLVLFSSSTMASITPRIHPRPQYPPLSDVLLSQAKTLGKSALAGTLLCGLICGPVQRLQQWAGLSDRLAFTLLANTVHTLAYVLFACTLSSFDYFGWFQQYKLHRKPYMHPSRELVMKTIRDAALSQLLVSPLFAYFIGFEIATFCGMPSFAEPLPPASAIAWQIMVAHLFNDWGFYMSHRLVHHPLLYARFHKQHHTYSGTIGIAAEFASPVETLFSNILPTLGGVAFFGRHPVVFSVWLFLRLVSTYQAHSGFCFRFLDAEGTIFHDHHHTSNRGNFGAPYIDWLFGTMDHYVKGGGVQGYLDRCSMANETNESPGVSVHGG